MQFVITDWFLIVRKRLYEMRTCHKRRDKDCETLGHWDLDRLTPTWHIMTGQWGKTWQFHLMKVRTIHACQGKNRELVRQRLRMLKIFLFSNDSHINVPETRLLLIFWKDSLNRSSLMTNWGFFYWNENVVVKVLTHKEGGRLHSDTCW